MRTTQLVIFLLSAGLSLTIIAALGGGVTFDTDQKLRVGPGSQAATAEVKKIWIGRPPPAANLQIGEADRLAVVSIPLMDDKTGREEGRMRCKQIHYHAASDRLRLEAPVVLMWEVDKLTGQVDRTKETRIVAREMFMDKQHREAEMVGDVVVTNQYRETEPKLTTNRLSFLLDERKIHTESEVRIQWGPDMTIRGHGLKGDSNLETFAIQRDGRLEMMQAGMKMLTPLEQVAPGIEKVKLIATCTGELIAKNLIDPEEEARKKREKEERKKNPNKKKDEKKKKEPKKPTISMIQLRDTVKVVREKATMTCQSLDLWLKAGGPPADGAGSGSAQAEVQRMVGRERVVLRDPDGEAFGEFFSWDRKADRQLMILRGKPRVISNNAGQMALVSDAPKSAQKTRERVEITCLGEMTFDRRAPDSTSKELDVAICRDKVRVRRTAIALEGPDAGKQTAAFDVDGEKLTMWMDRVERKTPKGTRMANEMKRSLVEGDVVLRDPTFTCSGDRLDWTKPTPTTEKMVVTGSPRMVVRNVEDDRGMEIGGRGEQPKAPRRIDIDIAAKTRLVMAGGDPKSGKRQMEFFDGVKVLRYELGADGKRVREEPLPSKLASDQLRVELARDSKTQQMTMDRMLADGHVKLDDEGGRSTSKKMRYDKEKGTLILERDVRVLDSDGGIYTGDRMDYDRNTRVGVLYGTDKVNALAKLPVEEEAAAGGPRKAPTRFHEVLAPKITFERGKGYLHAQVKSRFQLVSAVFYPAKEDGDFMGLGGEADKTKERQPWLLTCKDLKAWLNPRKKRAPGDKPPADGAKTGRLRELVATTTKGLSVELRSRPPKGQEDKTQTATGVKFHHKKGKDGHAITELFGADGTPATVKSARETLASSLIRMKHATGLAECPKGGRCRFMESDPDNPKAAPKPVNVTCDGKLLYKRNEWVEFYDEVDVRRSADGSRLKCDYLKCDLDPKTRQMRKALGTGKAVKIFSGQDEATGTRVDWDAGAKKMVLTAKPGTCRLQRGAELFRAPVVVFDQKTGRITTPKGMEKLR